MDGHKTCRFCDIQAIHNVFPWRIYGKKSANNTQETIPPFYSIQYFIAFPAKIINKNNNKLIDGNHDIVCWDRRWNCHEYDAFILRYLCQPCNNKKGSDQKSSILKSNVKMDMQEMSVFFIFKTFAQHFIQVWICFLFCSSKTEHLRKLDALENFQSCIWSILRDGS